MKELLGAFVWLVMVLAFAIAMIEYGHDPEISVKEYREVLGWMAAYPSLKPCVAESLADGVLLRSEYLDVRREADKLRKRPFVDRLRAESKAREKQK